MADDPGKPRHLDPNVLDSPAEALGCALRETLNLGDRVADMLRQTIDVLERNDPKAVKAIEAADNAVDRLYEAIKLYLIQISRTELGEEDGQRYVEILTFTTNLEHIGDIIDKNLMELATKKIRNRYAFSPEGMAELRAFHARVLENLRLALQRLHHARHRAGAPPGRREDVPARGRGAAADSHFARLREGRTELIETSSIHMDVIRDLKRINGHLASVAYPILEAAGELADTPDLEGRLSALIARAGRDRRGTVVFSAASLGLEPRAGEIDLELAAAPAKPHRSPRRRRASHSPGRPRRPPCGRRPPELRSPTGLPSRSIVSPPHSSGSRVLQHDRDAAAAPAAWPARSSSAFRPMKPPGLSSLTAKPRPACDGVSSGVSSRPQAR